ncbi:MAG: restriction endonuclease [Clostridia bacterium]|nr:restriction endonuclease [Clostridia bacterium]
MNTRLHKKIYSTIAYLLDRETLTREELIVGVSGKIKSAVGKNGFSVGDETKLRGEIGTVIDELISGGLIECRSDCFRLATGSPVILRAEACEKEILRELKASPLSKPELKSRLAVTLGTAGTLTERDDNILWSLIGKTLKRLESLGIIRLREGMYSVEQSKSAQLDDIDALLTLKGELLSRIHGRGGEFFEHYFMTLLGKYMVKHGKRVLSNKVMGGADDGGIDGIIDTEDSLGFKETIMVQMKNRLETTNETTVRGFWGSVCARGGSRGIFATTSDFHSSARDFMNSIDNCVGIDGDKIFSMACECLYGIKRKGGELAVDTRVV